MNSASIRRYNDKIVATAIGQLDVGIESTLELNCECDDPGCEASIRVPVWEHVARVGSIRLLVAPGHSMSSASLKRTSPDYDVIEPAQPSGIEPLDTEVDPALAAAATKRAESARDAQPE
jgi:hypothetical protein